MLEALQGPFPGQSRLCQQVQPPKPAGWRVGWNVGGTPSLKGKHTHLSLDYSGREGFASNTRWHLLKPLVPQGLRLQLHSLRRAAKDCLPLPVNHSAEFSYKTLRRHCLRSPPVAAASISLSQQRREQAGGRQAEHPWGAAQSHGVLGPEMEGRMLPRGEGFDPNQDIWQGEQGESTKQNLRLIRVAVALGFPPCYLTPGVCCGC